MSCTSNKFCNVKKRKKHIEAEITHLQDLLLIDGEIRNQDRILFQDGLPLTALFNCPLCKTEAGKRPKDRYFSSWDSGNLAQLPNLLYEIGIVIFGIASALPSWCNQKHFSLFRELLKTNRLIQENINLMECPYCRRFTNCLYGEGVKDNPHRCRWCYDRAGGSTNITLSVKTKSTLELLELIKDAKDGGDAVLQAVWKNKLDEYLASSIQINRGVPYAPLPEVLVPRPS